MALNRSARPKLLDLFCGAGGAAMGYHRAGFEVIGVDILPQPHYPFEFHQADALDFPWDGYAAIHASPPCQSHSTIRFFQKDHRRYDEEDRLPEMRARLTSVNVPWVLENVVGAPGPWSLLLCGTMFGLRVKRHRYFSMNWHPPLPPADCYHEDLLDMYSAKAYGRNGTDRQYVNEMGITWCPLENRGPAYPNGRQKLAQQAIPPAFTELIGRQMLELVGMTAFNQTYPKGSNYLRTEAVAVQKALADLEGEVAELRRQFKEWIEWPDDVELDDDLMVSMLRCHKLVSDVALAMSRRDRG